ncbi:MAG: hypothetical protein HOI53_06335 [Francisellaceae bacterium]|jgi:SEC-C motif domain protein|nr:hypothetical protein [Francisellaceae bacterium]MBT6207627.1 hypothetical protein [Francisellaceae bacterium]MBT6537855.1 hypothetical protein [Francisellaceae bacterium]
MSCYCKSGQEYINCCEQFHNGSKNPSTPEELMRSRYSAFATINMKYLKETMIGEVVEEFDEEEALAWSKSVNWVGLVVLEAKLIDPTHGVVEFEAFFKDPEEPLIGSMHERSTFTMNDGQWFYTGRLFNEHEQVDLEDKCPCASGKQFQKCCYGDDS